MGAVFLTRALVRTTPLWTETLRIAMTDTVNSELMSISTGAERRFGCDLGHDT